MKLKNILGTMLCTTSMFIATSCSLDYDPISQYSDVTEGTTEEGKEVVFKDKAAVETHLTAIYERLKEQEHWYTDKLLLSETHSDNAYAGSFGAEILPFESNAIDGTNTVLERDWTRFLKDVGLANTLVIYVDSVADNSLTEAEINRYKAQGRIFRSLIFFDMVRIWGNIPVVTEIAPNITNENFDEVYPLYFPKQTPEEDTYKQIESDLLFAVQYAPNNDSSNKRLMTKTVARALLAKVYAEKPIRNYDKVIQYADEVAADGIGLVDDFSMLFGMNDEVTDVKARNTKESILEAQFVTGGGNWCSWMFGRNLLNWDEQFSWAKWVTPSRDLIKLYETEGDVERYKQSVVYYECGWSYYYPSNNYPFMYKCRSSNSSIIRLRYADILLLKAEALIMKASPNLSAAADAIDLVRTRAKLPKLTTAVKSNQQSMLTAVMNERRMELAFEGERWYDLVRLDKVEEVMNAVYAKDSGRRSKAWDFTPNSYRLPIPLSVIQTNSNLVQNEGY